MTSLWPEETWASPLTRLRAEIIAVCYLCNQQAPGRTIAELWMGPALGRFEDLTRGEPQPMYEFRGHAMACAWGTPWRAHTTLQQSQR